MNTLAKAVAIMLLFLVGAALIGTFYGVMIYAATRIIKFAWEG